MTTKSTFAGVPACANMDDVSASISIIGIPHGTSYNLGKPSHSAEAPAAIRRAAERYTHMLDHYDFDLGGSLLDNRNIRVVDCSDVPGDPLDSVGNQRRATETIRSVLNTGAVPIVLGGDDSIPIPVFRAYQDHGPLTVIQIDAHLDWRHEINGITEGPSSTMRRASEMPWINRLIQVGMRGVGSARQEEVAAVQAYGAKILTAKDVHEGGIERILDLVPDGAACLVTIDCDGLDPSIMPAVNAPVPGGLSYRLVVDLLHGLTKKADVHGFDLVEFAPEKDFNGLGALTATRIVFNMIGALARSESMKKKQIFKRKNIMTDKEEILNFLMEIIGEEGCGVACKEAEIFKDQSGWKMFLEGFMEPWYIGKTVEEAKSNIKKYASMGFGLG